MSFSITELVAVKNLASQRIFLRADLNVPLHNGLILDDYRLQALLPTLDLLIAQKAIIIIATHIGRPKGHEDALSTRHLIPWFAQRGYEVVFAANPEEAQKLSVPLIKKKPTIILLENLRFWPEEKTGNKLFAQQLASCADYYVNDAFATLHRQDTSITIVPLLFLPDHRALGLCILQELTLLNKLIDQPKHPYVLVIGGGKIADKISLMHNLLDHLDTILLCPAIVFSFMHAQGLPTGSSLVDASLGAQCLNFLEKARQKNVRILMPIDYIVAQNTFNGPLRDSPVCADALEKNMVGISIGPDTADCYARELAQARTVFVNGLMGSVARPETLTGTAHLFTALAAATNAVRVIGGGDSVAAAHVVGFGTTVGHLSTGGGVTLAYIGGQQLPGLIPFLS